MAPLTRWWLVRHAPIASEWRGRIVGRTDVEADLAFDPAELRAGLPAEAVWLSSPLRRAVQTATALGAPTLHHIDAFAEQDHGDWEGETWSALARTDPEARAYWEAYDRLRPPGGESLEDVQRRVIPAFERLSVEHAGQNLVAVIHAGPIRCLLAHVLGFPLGNALKLSVDHLSVCRLEGMGPHWQVLSLNQRPGPIGTNGR